MIAHLDAPLAAIHEALSDDAAYLMSAAERAAIEQKLLDLVARLQMLIELNRELQLNDRYN